MKKLELRELIIEELQKLLNENFNNYAYLNWKRKNVTFRGIKEFGQPDNRRYGSFGKGLYTASLSNKSMARQYGDVYFVVNAIPKKPKIVNSLNDAEIFIQKIVINFCKKNNINHYDLNYFESNTTIEDEMLKLGYDGLIIKGREMVNYTPQKNILYFKTENELRDYFEEIHDI